MDKEKNIAVLAPKTRTFLPPDYKVKDWDTLEPYLEELKHRDLKNAGQLEQWLRQQFANRWQ